MPEEDPTSSKLSSMDGGTGKHYAPLGAPRPPRPNVMIFNKSHLLTCDSHSLFTGSGTGKPYAPFGAPRHPSTLDSSDFLGHASVTTHAVKLGSRPASPPWSDVCPPQPPARGASSNQNPIDNLTLTTPNSDAHPPKNATSHPNSQQPPTSKEDTNRILPNDATTLSFATWNANGLLTAEGLPEIRRKAKTKTLRKLLHDNDIAAVQEAHGQSEHWSTFKKQHAKSHKIFHSHDPDSRNKAGVAILINLKVYRQAFREEVIEVNPGRILTVRLFLAKGCLSATSLHNFEMNDTAQRQAAKHCAEEKRKAQNDEQGSSIHLIGGDFNFLARGETPTSVSTESLEIPIKHNDTRSTKQSNIKWSMMLANSMEHHQTKRGLATTPTPTTTRKPNT